MQPYKHALGSSTKNTRHYKNKNASSGYYAEIVVLQDLLKRGFYPFLATAFPMAYDILCDTGFKILRVSVKSTMQHRQHTEGGKISAVFKIQTKPSREKNLDIHALVDLPTGNIFYIEHSAVKHKLNIYVTYTDGVYNIKNQRAYKPHQLIRTNEWFEKL